jgi:prevent-host-death family protein
MTTSEVPFGEARAQLRELVCRVGYRGERITITRHGHAAAVIIAQDDLASLEETLDLLSDPAAMREIAEGRAAAARGEGLAEDQVRARYLHGRP